MKNDIRRFQSIIDTSHDIVFFTGAGVSVESGIPDFRSMGGLFDEIRQSGNSPEYLLSRDHLDEEPERFVQFYRKRLLTSDKHPNSVHRFIAEMETAGRSLGTVTQNIDGLHTEAGSSNVDELHGSLNRFYCISCNQDYTKGALLQNDVMTCECGGILRPDIVLYGEMLDERVLQSAQNKVSKADTLIVLGSSLVVNPAAYLLHYFKGHHLIIINREETPFDFMADLVINQDMTTIIENIEHK
ncbi:NAD-dependent protein deacylase [Salinicoccus siamensis]|uniref:protein acetyllysine N-acetyltransferase n=1 Tax=Salinicoccus siamensis TaxID=381830 RepID=A0ABV5Z135_9STAP